MRAVWTNDLISREFPISIGLIEIMGENYHQAAPKKADYILRLTQHGEALAVVETKEESAQAIQGMAQAKEYTQKMGIIFAYATNGHEIEELNFITNKQTTIKNFPSPEELRRRYIEAILHGAVQKEKAEKILKLPYPTIPHRFLFVITKKQQFVPLFRKLRRVKSAFAYSCTGTGKTIIAF